MKENIQYIVPSHSCHTRAQRARKERDDYCMKGWRTLRESQEEIRQNVKACSIQTR
jgi:hypothetical protein